MGAEGGGGRGGWGSQKKPEGITPEMCICGRGR